MKRLFRLIINLNRFELNREFIKKKKFRNSKI